MNTIDIEKSVRALKKDKHFAPVVKQFGAPDMKTRSNPFQSLVRAIIYQQLSGKAAASIYARFLTLFPGKGFPKPEAVLAVSAHKLRSTGISARKAEYLHDLAGKFTDGTITPAKLKRMENDDVCEHLLQIKGVGEWTAHMFLLFTLKRADVLPTGDLGIRRGFQELYKLKELPDKEKMEKLARPWREHSSVACWYLWRVSDARRG